MDDKIVRVLMNDLKRAKKKKEVPVSALIVYNNKIIAHAHNGRVSKRDVTAHAEVLVIKKAARILKDWRLSECEMYVTLEPCAMCREVIKEARLSKVYYYVSRETSKKGFSGTLFKLLTNNNSNSFQQFLSSFFKDNGNR